MRTVCIQIGNSDNKLSQKQWADFCTDVYKNINLVCNEIFFSAPSVGWADWQNAAFIFSIDEEFISELKTQIEHIRKGYLQDSVAWLEGETVFI